MKYLLAVFGALISVSSFSNEHLDELMFKLDSEMFESFNNCTSESELKKHASYFSVDVEFYHDNGGVTWDRELMIQNTKKNVCGKYQRKLLSDSFRAFPINGFGAITQGVHIFCQVGKTDCEGKAHFTMVWRNTGNEWVVTRALSYGHRMN